MEIGALNPQVANQTNNVGQSADNTRLREPVEVEQPTQTPSNRDGAQLQEDRVSLTSAPEPAAETPQTNLNTTDSAPQSTETASTSLATQSNTGLSLETENTPLVRDENNPAQELESRINDILGEPSEIERQVDELV